MSNTSGDSISAPPADAVAAGSTPVAPSNAIAASDPLVIKQDKAELDMLGVHFAVSIFCATTVLWIVLKELGDANPIWSISSMIATSDPQVHLAMRTFRGRIANSLLGCVIGLIFVLAIGPIEWVLPFALAVTVLISAYAIRIPVMWRQAPITAAIVISSSFAEHSRRHGAESGLRRVGEVLLGCVVGLSVAWFLSKIWPPPATGHAPDGVRK